MVTHRFYGIKSAFRPSEKLVDMGEQPGCNIIKYRDVAPFSMRSKCFGKIVKYCCVGLVSYQLVLQSAKAAIKMFAIRFSEGLLITKKISTTGTTRMLIKRRVIKNNLLLLRGKQFVQIVVRCSEAFLESRFDDFLHVCFAAVANFDFYFCSFR